VFTSLVLSLSLFSSSPSSSHLALPCFCSHAVADEHKLSDVSPNPEIGAYLQTVPVLAGKLSQDECARLGGAMRPRRFAAGEAVVREGEQGDEFYIIQYVRTG
jgi:hypothetical protein